MRCLCACSFLVTVDTQRPFECSSLTEWHCEHRKAPRPFQSQPSSHFARLRKFTSPPLPPRLCFSNWESWPYGWVWQMGQLSHLTTDTLKDCSNAWVCLTPCAATWKCQLNEHSHCFLWTNKSCPSLFSTGPRGPREAWGNRRWRAEWAV